MAGSGIDKIDDCMIYVIGTMDGPKKIGYAKNPEARLRTIRRRQVSVRTLYNQFGARDRDLADKRRRMSA